MLNLWSFAGLLALVAIAWLCSEARRAVAWKPVAAALTLQLAIGALVFLVPWTDDVFLWLNDVVLAVLKASQRGIEYVFGPLAVEPGAAGSIGFVLAFQVLPVAVFVSALAAAAYRLGLIQPLVRGSARLFQRTLGLSGAEALGAGANLFVGVEAALVVRPWLERMTRSELLVLLTTGMATVASTVLVLYTRMLTPVLPTAAGHLISATVISIPAAILVAKLLVPERETPVTVGALPTDGDDPARRGSVIGALMQGGMDGMRLAVGIAVGLIALLGVVALADLLLAQGRHLGLASPPTIADLLTYAAYPFAALLGVTPADIAACAKLLGERAVLTEFVAFGHLHDLRVAGAVSARSLTIMSYALCGFAHIASIAVFVGGTAAVVPSRRDDLARLGPRALLAATLATLMTGCIAGIFSGA
ncbi:MAG: hypothetical protein H0X45_07840 [Planctomycetes bacterium]|nr:hypothetical protein [Planctomycetota bacterium]